MNAPSPDRFDGPVLVDAHVHLHGCFETGRVLEHAWRNFAGAARRLGLERPLGVLMLTESAGVHRFRELRRGEDAPGSVRIERTAEDDSLLARRGDGGQPPLVLIAGRQVVAAEALEVLALACVVVIPDGLPLAETLERVRAAGGLPAVPWGFGKWWFGRGRRVAELIDAGRPGRLFLGDNGGRLARGGRPRHFATAERRGLRVLPGSDPLPFPHHAGRAGSFGFTLVAPLDLRKPAAAIRALLPDPAVAIRPYGRGEGLLGFVRNQVGMQLVKRSREAAS